ncbi:MAG: ABC transporter ATP-binding protein [Erysipelotrichaceae bacterium]|nr:ABC transporter ATP-binding protein [Erysipelotrichaceae bacterium]
MPEIRLDDVTMIFPFQKVTGIFGRKEKEKTLQRQKEMPYTSNEGVIALQHCSLVIPDRSFTVIVGPSGSGKSTLLRIIAGLERQTLGTVSFDGKDMEGVRAEDRDISMVFQNYSLYPNQTVYQNIAFPLEVKHMPREEIEKEVNQIASLLRLDKKLNALPQDLSGGEKQRVAIARSMVKRPSILLLDEPFSNLDAPMRNRLRNELKKIHQAYDTTFVYVTHDRYDALTLAERIVILKDGIIEMEGTRAEVYNEPVNRFCASFLGTPEMNFFEEVPVSSNGTISLLGARYELTGKQRKALGKEKTVTVGIRGVNIAIGASGEKALVKYVEPIEADLLIHAEKDGIPFTVVERMKEDYSIPYFRDQEISVRSDSRYFHLFDKEGKRL